MTMLFHLTVLLGTAALAVAQTCTEVPDSQKSPLPDFNPDEFTVDIEIASKERQRVIQTTMYYSRPKNMIRLSMTDQKMKSDLYFYFMDDEVFAFDYSLGRGSCTVKNISSAAEAYIIGGSKSKGKIQEPLGVLRMTGLSGFPTNHQINVKKSSGTLRDMAVDSYTSCQLWKSGSQNQLMQVTHYFSTPTWQFPDAKSVPVGIKVVGTGRMKNMTMGMNHVYSFFNFRFSVDPIALETPEGIYCKRRQPYPFPTAPNFIKFSAETIDNINGQTHYMEEIFDVDDRFAIMTMQDRNSFSSSTGMGRRTFFRDYKTGLSFDIDNIMQSCAVRNISDAMEAKLPFDFISAGKVHQLTADQFFYKGNNSYQYLGQRTIRSIPCDTFVTKAPILNEPNSMATLEWYFAINGTKSWNDDASYFKDHSLRLPVKFQVWPSDASTQSISVNMYHVDYAKLRYGTFDIRPCFASSPSNYIQLVLPSARRSVVDNNIDNFRWKAQFDIAEIAQVIWWRVADLQVYFETDDVIIEFELLDAPPFSGDAPSPIPTPPLDTATANIQQAVSSGMNLNAYNKQTNKYDQKLLVSKSTQLSANKGPGPVDTSGGYGAAAMAGVGVAMVVVGGAAGGVGSWFLIK